MSTKKNHIVITKTQAFLSKTPKSRGVTLAKDKDGYFCYTHRCRSKSHKTISGITKKEIEFIESTG